MAEFDLVVRGGRVMDGTGGSSINADIAIKDGLIAEVGNIKGSASRELDADGALVTPGFVDIHTHYDGQATWSNRLNPSSHHGVTTVVMGNCGVGFAPVRGSDHDTLVKLMEGVEDIPGVALHEGLPWSWESFPDYLDFLGTRKFDMDIAAQLPHAALRVYVMGERGANREDATSDDIAQMKQLTSEAMRAGAIGFSSSRTLNHRSSTGDPTPSLTAAEAELVGIGEGVRAGGGGVIEMISDFKDFDGEFDILKAMSLASGSPMSISLAQSARPDGWKKILARIDEANDEGLRFRAQVAPRAIGILLGLTTTMNPFSAHERYREIRKLPLAERLEKLRAPGFKDQLLAETPSGGRAFFSNFSKMWTVDDTFDYEPAPADSIAARAQAQGVSPLSLAYDLMIAGDGKQLFYTPFANYAEDNLDCCREMILAENTVMGLGDGGAHVGTICDASFITFLLTHWGRDRKRGDLIDLETLIKAQTADTAAAVGLTDRGVLVPGKRADINVIDFDRLSIDKPYMVADLPAGGARLEQQASGFLATVVAGEVTYLSGEPTDALPGRLVRRRHD